MKLHVSRGDLNNLNQQKAPVSAYRGSASNYWFDDNKRFEPVTNTVTKAIQNTVVHEPYL